VALAREIKGQAKEGLAEFGIFASRRWSRFCKPNKTRQPHFCRSSFLSRTANFASPSKACPTKVGHALACPDNKEVWAFHSYVAHAARMPRGARGSRHRKLVIHAVPLSPCYV
jgi:hypothetical protein